MLVLSRKPGQDIVAGAITFSVLKVVGNKVSIGIDAPRDVPIRRNELEPIEAGQVTIEANSAALLA